MKEASSAGTGALRRMADLFGRVPARMHSMGGKVHTLQMLEMVHRIGTNLIGPQEGRKGQDKG